MKIGLIGHKGFLGDAFLKSKSAEDEIILFNRGNSLEILKDCNIIINANGNSSKVLAERDPITDFDANATFTLELSLYAREIDSLLVHISSGEAVTVPSVADKDTNPLNQLAKLSSYGLSKAVGEVLVKKYSPRSLIIRPSGLIGPGMKKGPIFDIIMGKPLWIHPSSTLNIMRTSTTARIVFELANTHLKKELKQEEFNLTGEKTITLFEAAVILQKDLVYEENLPIYNSTADSISSSKNIHLPTSKDELKTFYHEISNL